MGYHQCAAAKVGIDVRFRLYPEHPGRKRQCLIHDIEVCLAALKTGPQIGSRRRKLRILGVINYAQMLVQTQPTQNVLPVNSPAP